MSNTTIKNAWRKAETAIFEALVSATGATARQNAFRGQMPNITDAWGFTSGGGSASETTAAGCFSALQYPAKISGRFSSRDSAQDFAGLVLQWLSDTTNAQQKYGNVQLFKQEGNPLIDEETVELAQESGNSLHYSLQWDFELTFNTRIEYS